MKYLIAFALCMFTVEARGDTFNIPCGPYESAVKQLAEKYDERILYGGITTGGAGIVEVWVAPDGKTWTVVVHGPDGKSCLLAAGTDWGSLTHEEEGI